MANPLKGEVEFVAGEKAYTIRFNTDTLCTLEGQIGIGFGDIVDRLRRMNFAEMRVVLRAALGEKATLKQANGIIDQIGYPATLNHVMEAFRLAYPDLPNSDDDEDEDGAGGRPQTGAAAGTGQNS